MDNHTYRSAGDRETPRDGLPGRIRLAGSGDVIAYLQTIAKLRDIYIDSSLFRNPNWDVLLTLRALSLQGLPAPLAVLCSNARLAQDDCAEAIEKLREAGLVALQPAGSGSAVATLTEQGEQRMDAFLRSAARGQ